jgi:putative PIN family toxin of toxin-antitoxin system
MAEHDLVVGDVILSEFRRMLRTKFKTPDDRIALVESVLTAFPIIPKPAEPSELLIRDPADRWILATAIAGAADVLVTGDRDLLDVHNESPIRILDPRAFWELLRAGPTE